MLNYQKVLFEFSPEAIVVINVYGIISDVNPQSETLFKSNKSKLVGDNITNFLQNRDDLIKILSRVSEFNLVKKYETSIKFKNKPSIPVLINSTVFQEPDTFETYLVLIIEDITEQKKAEKEVHDLIENLKISRSVAEEYSHNVINLMQLVEESQNELQELNASKDKFFSIIAHDLKGPLSGITALLDSVMEDLDSFTMEDYREYLVLIHDYISSTYKLLENLLSWARLQRGNMPNNPELIFLHFVANNSVGLLKANADQKKITLKIDIDSDLRVFADSNMVYTVIRNLLSNSIKFTPENGEVTIFASILDDDRIICGVQDNGIGMTDEVKDKLFKIGVHHTTLGTKNEKGTGLGLVLCKELVEQSSGQIWVESELGVGTSFVFTLKRHRDDETANESTVVVDVSNNITSENESENPPEHSTDIS